MKYGAKSGRGEPPTEGRGKGLDVFACPTKSFTKRCLCGLCEVCGYPKHTAIHGTLDGQPAGSEAYGHEFEPRTP